MSDNDKIRAMAKIDAVQRFKYLIFSENPDTLLKFYTDGLGFEVERKVEEPLDYGYFIRLSARLQLFIGRHSEILGQNKDSLRHIFDLCVDSVNQTWEKIKDTPGLQVIAEPFDAPCSRVATFADPEGNTWQISELMACELCKPEEKKN